MHEITDLLAGAVVFFVLVQDPIVNFFGCGIDAVTNLGIEGFAGVFRGVKPFGKISKHPTESGISDGFIL